MNAGNHAVSITSEQEAYNHILEIQRDYTARKDRVLDSLAGAMWIVEKMFARAGHFILEFIQNAEDAKATKVKVVLKSRSLEIFNNGNPFSRDDVEAICSIGRSRKDPREYVGYLGVGFKAVFLVSSKPHIYSKPYRFKFDRNFWPDSRLVPWQITPIWLDKVPDEYKEWNVVFYIPIDEKGYERIKNELERLAPTTLLFLHNITEVELEFEGKTKVFRKEDKGGGICTLEVVENGSRKVSNWIVFREIIKVPDEIKKDKFTKDWNRDMVEKREIAVAFGLDDKGDLMPITGTVKFGVFSYVPLREEEIGIPFLIHADFLVAPGREMMQREAPWNIWMLDELTRFITNSVIKSFKAHSTWRFSYTNVLYSSVYHSPFDIHLSNPINIELMHNPHLVDLGGNFVKASEAIQVTNEVLQALGQNFIEKITARKVLHPKTRPHPKLGVKMITSVKDLGRDFVSINSLKAFFGDTWKEALRDYLRALAQEWFKYAESTRKSYHYQSEYSVVATVIDEEDEQCYPKDISIPVSSEVEQKAKQLFPRRFRFLHSILREELILKMLKELGSKELTKDDLERLIKKEQVPRLIKELKDPSISDQRKVEILEQIEKFWEEGIVTGYELIEKGILIRTKRGEWVEPKNALLSSEYRPEPDIERLVKNNLLDFEFLEFVDPIFIKDKTLEEREKWREFLTDLKIGSEIREERLVERVGTVSYTHLTLPTN